MACSRCRRRPRSGVISLVIVLLGLLLLLRPSTTGLVIGYAVGFAALVYGALRLLSHCRCREPAARLKGELVLGLTLICLGLFAVIRPAVIAAALPLVLGAFLLLAGVINVQRALRLKCLCFDRWWLAMLLAILLLALGVLLICNPFAAATTAIRFVGLCLLIQGIVDAWTRSCFCRS